MKRTLEFAAVVLLALICTASVLFWAVSGRQDQVLAGNQPAGNSSVGAPIALMDKGLTPDAIGYWKLEAEANSASEENGMEVITITAPRYRINGQINLSTSKIATGNIDQAKLADKSEEKGLITKIWGAEPGFLGEYRVTIKRGDKQKKVWLKHGQATPQNNDATANKLPRRFYLVIIMI